jgi:hypothetical protein
LVSVNSVVVDSEVSVSVGVVELGIGVEEGGSKTQVSGFVPY